MHEDMPTRDRKVHAAWMGGLARRWMGGLARSARLESTAERMWSP